MGRWGSRGLWFAALAAGWAVGGAALAGSDDDGPVDGDDVEDIEPDADLDADGKDNGKDKDAGKDKDKDKGDDGDLDDDGGKVKDKDQDKGKDNEDSDKAADKAADKADKAADKAAGDDKASPAPVPAGMAGHFQQAALLMLAVAVNDNDGAKDLAKSLADDKAAPPPLRSAAKEVVGKASDSDKAAPKVAELARTCSNCHLAGGRGPVPHDVELLPDGDPVEQHIMAAMFIWIGLVTPVEQPYLVGLGGLLPPIDLESDAGAQAIGDVFTERTAEARDATSWDQRSEVFGVMLGACAACHERMGVHSVR